MTFVVFVGPTLPAAEVHRLVEGALVLPPAAQGDLYRAARTRPRAIGLIDGYFDRKPAVWHKEILWAIKEGIPVFGAASMGALRAAELCPFGMVGVGVVFEDLRSGRLEDDDEVAVVHRPAEEGFAALSEAMVNIRATLHAAVEGGVITAGTAERLGAIAKGLFYPERSFRRMMALAAQAQLPEPELTALQGWWPAGRVDQKGKDAAAMLVAMKAMVESEQFDWTVDWVFEHTDAWETVAAGDTGQDAAARHELDAVLDEIRAEGRLEEVVTGTIAHLLSLRAAESLGTPADEEAVRQAAGLFRLDRGLEDDAAFREWLAGEGLEREAQARAFFRQIAELRRVRSILEPELMAHLADHLRSRGLYGRYRERCRLKQAALGAARIDSLDPGALGLSESELWGRYFGEVVGRPVPTNLAHYATEQGFDDVGALRAAAVGELAYRRLTRS
jgi:hypothetical protein